jgi:hypothetical protein
MACFRPTLICFEISIVICVFITPFLGCRSTSLPPKATAGTPPRDHIGAQAQCTPRFPDTDGWLGGDAAYSIPLASTPSQEAGSTSLWLFGDTFIESPGRKPGRQYPFAHNTVGVSHCRADGDWKLATFWGQSSASAQTAFFEPDPNAAWVRHAQAQDGKVPYYWPFDGFVAHGSLFVGLLRVVPSDARGPFNLPFRLVGMDLARVDNPLEPPEQWRIRISTLSENPHAIPGSTFVVEGNYVYAFVFFDGDDGRSPRALSRIPLRALRVWDSDLSKHFETFDRAGRWVSGFRPDRARILMDDDATEMSVHFDPEIDRWVAIYATSRPTTDRSGTSFIYFRSAPRIEGPWSDALKLFAIPETRRGKSADSEDNLFCYAAKAHPQFAPAGSLLVTYVCNLFARNEAEILPILERLKNSPELYRPRAVRVPIPELDGTAAIKP